MENAGSSHMHDCQTHDIDDQSKKVLNHQMLEKQQTGSVQANIDGTKISHSSLYFVAGDCNVGEKTKTKFTDEPTISNQSTRSTYNECNIYQNVGDIYMGEKTKTKFTDEITLKEAADTIQKHQLKKLEPDVAIRGLAMDQAALSNVCQDLAESDVFQENEPPKNESFHPSTHANNRKKFDSSKRIQFDSLLSTMINIGFLALIGPPGCGKTTLAKRLAKFNNFFVIFLRFMDLGYDSALTLKQLLVDFPFNDVDQTTKDNAFAWMLKNQEKCVIIIDGYDQATWFLSNEKPTNVSHETSLPIQELVANLCCKIFFSKSLLIFTSRPHSILSLPIVLRPKLTVVVGDLPTDGMQKLFFTFAGRKAEHLWKTFHTNAPQLIQLCHNPMLLQFVVYSGLNGDVNQVNTITKVFKKVLLQLETSVYKQGVKFCDLVQPLGKMAYGGMLRRTVVFANVDILKAGLKDVNIQDFVIKVALCPSLFEGNASIFYFMHQTLQEMFAAMYICMIMRDSEFHDVIHQVIHESHWSMVRRFMCGLLLGDDLKEDHWTTCIADDEINPTTHDSGDRGLLSMFRRVLQRFYTDKPTKFRNRLKKFMKADISEHQRIDLLTDIQECSDDERDSLAKFLPLKFDFRYTPFTSSTAHAFAQNLPRLCGPVEWLNLSRCKLNLDSLKMICEGISKLKYKMESLNLDWNEFGDEGAKVISVILNKVGKLWLNDCGISATGLEVLCGEIKKLETPMKYLDLSWNKFGDEGVKIISVILNKVGELGLRYCGISATGLEVLCGEIKKLETPMKYLDLSWNKFGDEGVKIISVILNKVGELGLSGCGISATGLEVLCGEIKKLETPMEFLNLSLNEFGDEGVKIISVILNKVGELWLSGCGISATGLKVLCEEIKKLETPMKYLDLSWNKFGDEGVKIISVILNKVGELGLSGCGISATGLEVLCGEIKKLETPMEFLNLSLNEFGDEGVKIISVILNKVGELWLVNCGISERGIQILREELKRLGLPISTISF